MGKCKIMSGQGAAYVKNAAKVKRHSVAGDIPGGTFVQEEVTGYLASTDPTIVSTIDYHKVMDWATDDCTYGLEVYTTVSSNSYQRTVHGRIVTQDVNGTVTYSTPTLLWTSSNYFSVPAIARFEDNTFLVVAQHYECEACIVTINPNGVVSVGSRTGLSLYKKTGSEFPLRIQGAPTMRNRFAVYHENSRVYIEARGGSVFQIGSSLLSYDGCFLSDDVFAAPSSQALFREQINPTSVSSMSYILLPGAVNISRRLGYMNVSDNRTILVFVDMPHSNASTSDFKLYFIILKQDGVTTTVLQGRTLFRDWSPMTFSEFECQCLIDSDKVLMFLPHTSVYSISYEACLLSFIDEAVGCTPYSDLPKVESGATLYGCPGMVRTVSSQFIKNNIILNPTLSGSKQWTTFGRFGNTVRKAESYISGLTATMCTTTKQGSVWRWKK